MKAHIVNKICLVMPASDYNQARSYQAAAKHWATHTLASLLGNHFEKISRGDDILFIEKIEINLTDLPWNLPNAQWQEQLAATIRVNQFSTNTFELIFKQWYFYLNNGCFEMPAICKNIREIETYLLSHYGSLSVALLKRHSSNITLPLLQRLFYQHTKELVTGIIEKMLDLPKDYVSQVYTIMLNQLKAQPFKTFALFSKILQANQSGDVKEKEKWMELVLRKAIPVTSIDDAKRKDHQPAQIIKKNKRTDIPDTIVECPHAGLVLLFPYLQRFLEKCKLVENNAFITAVAQKIAIQALHFLATGDSFGREEALVLPKLLCGQELKEYVEFEQALPAPIMTEGNELLQSVIDNWKILQHTSVEGLRETFLKRNGKLIHKTDIYTLQVEESGVDILLNNIPWGFRNYKLPWMRTGLITQWY